MNATQNRAGMLDRAAVHIRAAQLAAARAGMLVARDAAGATEQAAVAKEEARRALVIVTSDLGATMPPIQPGGEAGKEKTGLDLAALATMDTPDARELLTLLEQAQAVAERVDASRGRTVAPHIVLMPGESQGTDLAESVSEIAARLRAEVFGRNGKGE